MNRHARRAAGKTSNGLSTSLGGISEMVEKLRPYISQIEELKSELATAVGLLRQTQSENAALMGALNTQQAVYLRLFAQGMGVSLDTVVLMAGEIKAQLTQGETDGVENLRTPSAEETEGDSSP